MNKIKFWVGIDKNQCITIKDNINTRLYIKGPNNWKYITSIKYVGGKRDIIPNIPILNNK